ncbi:MAG: Na(+)/H(+) antiporter subunit B [Planctomycetota bacterium]|jgi:multicomponent Na+:H+ antiporter subunit B
MRDQVVPRVIARMLIPYMLVYGFYVASHGELGPGGGFQAGVILAAALILHSLVHGLEETQRGVPRRWVDRTMAFGVLLYIGVGIHGLLAGNAFLDYSSLALGATDPESIHGAEAMGMTLVETGVTLTVAAVMVTLFDKFATAARR